MLARLSILCCAFLISLIAAMYFLSEDATTNCWQAVFIVAFLFRHVRTFVSIYAYYHFSADQLPHRPHFASSDVSVVVPTKFSNPPEHIRCLNNILACSPKEVIVITSVQKLAEVSNHLAVAGIAPYIQLGGVEILNKKNQMIEALKNHVTGRIVCFADDDVQWLNPKFLPTMLACFEDPTVGAAGPKQRVTREASSVGIASGLYHFLGICYILRRNYNTAATQYMDGALSTLSGRTSMYRAEILKSDLFFDYFSNARNHDDDKNLTRWTFVQGWKIKLQFHPDALIETTLETDFSGYMNQCLRWARGHWRGNFRVMSSTDYWWKTHTWSLYAIYVGQFQTPALLVDVMLTFLLHKALLALIDDGMFSQYVYLPWTAFVLFTKVHKIIPHFCRHPGDLLWMPLMIAFSYLHGFINLWALATTNNTAWGVTGASAAQMSKGMQ